MRILHRCILYTSLILSINVFASSAFSQTVGNWNFNNTLAGTAGSNNTVSAASLSPSIGSGAYNGGTVYYGEDGWPTGAINTNMYIAFTLTPNAGYTLNLTSIDLNMRRSTTGSPAGSGPRQWSIRSSIDGFAADITTGTLTQNPTPTATVSLGSAFNNVNTPITFRLYGYDVFNNPGGLNRFVYDNITVKGLMLLPISFSAFTGNIVNTAAILNWQIGDNTKLNYFDIERSVDGTSFTTINKVTSNSGSFTSYTCTDNVLPRQSAVVYYRVKSVELSGAIKYSSIIKLTIEKSGGLQINTIISGSQINAQVTTAVAGSATIVLTTFDGRTIYQQQTILAKGTQSVTINNNFTTGIYALTFMQNGKLVSRQFRN
jgi:hypothetical protein